MDSTTKVDVLGNALVREPTAAELDYARRVMESRSLSELHAILETAPEGPNDSADFVAAINESRRHTGFRFPD